VSSIVLTIAYSFFIGRGRVPTNTITDNLPRRHPQEAAQPIQIVSRLANVSKPGKPIVSAEQERVAALFTPNDHAGKSVRNGILAGSRGH
jgi:hypothetical protein